MKASSLQSSSPCLGCSGGNPRSGSHGSDDGDDVSFSLLGASFSEQMMPGGILRWSGVVSSAPKTMGLGGMVQRFDGRCVLMDARRAVVHGGVDNRTGKIMLIFALKMKRWFDGGGGF